MIRKCYPDGKRKAFNVTYDDGVLQDIPLVALLNKYGIKGTFNLNSGLMEQEFAWVHESGMTVQRLSAQTVRDLYDGHEIASHTLTHPYMHDLSENEILHQMGLDRWNLQQLFGREVLGFAVPFDYYSSLIADCAQKTGFRYARMSDFTGNYTPCRDYYRWKCGFYHVMPGLEDYVSAFLLTDEELALCQIVGHSYDLDAMDLWAVTEKIFRTVSACGDVWLATNLQILDYLRAMDCLEMMDGCVINRSDRDIWVEIDGITICLHPGDRVKEEIL